MSSGAKCEDIAPSDELHRERGVRFSEQLPQRRHSDLEHPAAAVGGECGPEFFDEAVGAHDSPVVENEHRQEGSLFRRGV